MLTNHSWSYIDVRGIDVVTSPSVWHWQSYSRVVDYMSVESNKPCTQCTFLYLYILEPSHLSTPKLTGVHILVSVLGTVGYGNVVNTTWIINNFLRSCMGKEYNVYIEYSIKYVHACNNYSRIHWLISIFNNKNYLCMQLHSIITMLMFHLVHLLHSITEHDCIVYSCCASVTLNSSSKPLSLFLCILLTCSTNWFAWKSLLTFAFRFTVAAKVV